MELLGKDGRYELRAPIGQGPRTSVNHGVDRHRHAPVVIKRFAAGTNLGSLSKIVDALRPANIPGVLLPQDLVVTPEPVPFVVYPALAGETLESAQRSGPMQWARAAELVSSCAAILAAVTRAAGLTHRALKPTNVWLTADGDPRLMDFSSAASGPAGPLRRGPDVLEYRAPEQLDGSPGDARSDVFVLAVLLVELTTGVHPFSGATPFQAAHKLTQTPPDLAELTRGMSSTIARDVAAHVARSLAGNPSDRPPDAAAFADKLNYLRSISGAPAPQRPTRPVAQPPQPALPAEPVDDHTTLMQLPNMRHMFAKPAASSPAPAAPTPAPAPPPAAPPAFAPPVPEDSPAPAPPRPTPRPTPVPEDIPARPAPAPRRAPVPRDSPPQRHAAVAPARPTPRPTAAPPYERTETLPVAPPQERTEMLPVASPQERTEMLPVAPRFVSPVPQDSSPTDEPADRTEQNIRLRHDAAIQQMLGSLPARLPDDELATFSFSRPLYTAPRSRAETTLLLPETVDEQPPRTHAPTPQTTTPSAEPPIAPVATATPQPLAPVTPATPRPLAPPRSRIGLLIAVNLVCVLVLILVIVFMR